MKIHDLTFTEETIMMVLWSLESAYLKDIILAHPEPRPHQNTISTYLKILQDKKFVSTEKEGRIFKYHVEISLEEYKSYVLSEFLERYFQNSSTDLIQKLIADELLKVTDLKLFLEEKTTISIIEQKPEEEESAVLEFIKELTKPKKKKKKKKKKKE